MAWPLIVAGGLAAASAIGNYLGARQDAENAEEAYDRIQGLAEKAGTANTSDINKYKALVSTYYGDGASQYDKALQKFLDSEVYQNKDFAFVDENGNPITVDKYMDPAYNQRVDAAMQAIENSSAAGGNRFSSDFINRVGAKQQALASEEWEKAYNRLMSDRAAALNEYNVNAQNHWNNYNATNDRNKYLVDAYGNDRNAYISGMGDALTASINNRTGVLNSQAQAIAGTTNAQQGTGWGHMLGGLGSSGLQFMSSYFGGAGK